MSGTVTEFVNTQVTAFGMHSVEVGDTSLRYAEAGTGPGLVCLHGAGGLQLTRSHEMLAETHRVIAFEVAGFGETPSPEPESLDVVVEQILRGLDALEVDTFALMATSFGAKPGLLLAVAAPARVSCVVLESPAAIRPETAAPPPADPAELAARFYAHPDRMPPVSSLPVEVQQRQMGLAMRLLGPPRDADFEAKLATLKMPVLAIFGTRDGVIPPETGRLYKRLIDGSHFALIYDAGHSPSAERPEAYVELVSDFLARGNDFVVANTSTRLFP